MRFRRRVNELLGALVITNAQSTHLPTFYQLEQSLYNSPPVFNIAKQLNPNQLN